MDLARRVACKLAREGIITIEQKKITLDHDLWDQQGRKGIVRLRLLASEGARPPPETVPRA